MPKIGICVKNLTSGGAEKQAVMLANVLAERHQVSFIILNGEKIHSKYLDMLSPVVQIVKFDGDKKERLKQYRQWVLEETPDLIFSYLTAANYYSVRAARGTATKVVTGLRNSRLPLSKHIADALLNRIGAVMSVCNCESGKRHFASKGFKGSKIVVIPNCFDPIDSYRDREPTDIVNVITVGRFVPQKDYHTAIRAVAEASRRCPQLRFTVIGYGELETQVRGWLREEGIEGITRILIDSDRVADELRMADIYMSTSLFEGISNSIMEGMNADMPIVATSVGDNDVLVKSGVNGYLTVIGDYAAIAGHLVELVVDVDKRREMGRRSKEILEANFTKELFAERYNNLITMILGR
ncbi:MAG: glycosyltransferase [Bacteroidales bacterium]|nr:glycosyltransferase [Bacteroidales bacterium]